MMSDEVVAGDVTSAWSSGSAFPAPWHESHWCVECGCSCRGGYRCSGIRRGHLMPGWQCLPCGGIAVNGGTGEVVAGRSISTLAESSADPRPAGEPCLVCGGRVPPSRFPLRCSLCHKACHKKCTSLSREEMARPNPCGPAAPALLLRPRVGRVCLSSRGLFTALGVSL